MISPKEAAIAKLISKAWFDNDFLNLLNSDPVNALLGTGVSHDEFSTFAMTDSSACIAVSPPESLTDQEIALSVSSNDSPAWLCRVSC